MIARTFWCNKELKAQLLVDIQEMAVKQIARTSAKTRYQNPNVAHKWPLCPCEAFVETVAQTYCLEVKES